MMYCCCTKRNGTHITADLSLSIGIAHFVNELNFNLEFDVIYALSQTVSI